MHIADRIAIGRMDLTKVREEADRGLLVLAAVIVRVNGRLDTIHCEKDAQR